MKTSTFNSLATWAVAGLTVMLLFFIIHVIAISLQYASDDKLKTEREIQQQQDRIEQKIDLILEK